MTMRSQSFMSFLHKDKARKEHNRLCCAKCRFSTKDTVLFQRHVAHHREVMFSCALCSHVSYSKTESQKHVVSHTGSYPFRCSFCSYGAVRRDYIVKHIHRIHRRHAEKNLVTNFAISSPASGHQSASNTHIKPGWSDRTEQCINPSTASQSNANVKYLSGSQTRTSTSSVISKTVSKTSSKPARFTLNTSSKFVANTTSGKTQLTGAIPGCASKVTHSLGNTLQVVSRPEQENEKLSSFLVSGDSQSKLSISKTKEKLIQKARGQGIPKGCTEQPLKSPRVDVPEKTIHSKTVSKVQVRLPVEINSPLRPLLNMPMRALSQKSVAVQNVQTHQRVGQSAAGTNLLTAQKMSSTAALPNSPIKHSERSSLLEEQTTEKSNQPMTNSRILIESSAEKSSPLSNVQVELLAPLNQPIQHNKPLTVSCPEEINIPAGCLVELVEVKTVNGTRELELRLIPPNGISQNLKGTVDVTSPNSTTSKLSFKCLVAAGSTASTSKSLTSESKKQQPPLPCTDVQSIIKTVRPARKPQCSSDTAQTMNNYQKSNSVAVRPSMAACEATEVSSEGLPVISSVFSLCPSPTSTQSISQFMREFHNSTLQTNGPPKMISNAECKMAALKKSKGNVVCGIRIKKEEESQEKHKAEDSWPKESKTEPESIEKITKIKACSQEETEPVTTQNMFEKCSNFNTSDLKENPNMMTSPLTAVILSNRDNILDEGKASCQYQSGSDFGQHSCRASLMYPKVALVRIPSSMLEPTKKIPLVEESLTARPVLCCTVTEQNVSRGPEGAIKLILKRNFPESKDQNHDAPSRKKRKKEKNKKCKSSSVVMDFHSFLSKGHGESRLTPLKEDQLIKLPGPNQPVVVLNHPNPLVEMVSVGVQTLKDYKWIQTEVPVRKQPSLKMKLRKIQGQKYQVIELVLSGVSEKLLS